MGASKFADSLVMIIVARFLLGLFAGKFNFLRNKAVIMTVEHPSPNHCIQQRS